jgi:hypothetical protein
MSNPTPLVKKSCDICCSNRTTFIKCPYCPFESCSDCSQKYLLDNIVSKCMSCSKQWSYEFIQNNFSVTFVNTKYKKHREDILLNKEKSLLPNTQLILEKKKKEKEIQAELEKLREREEFLKMKLHRLQRQSTSDVYIGRKNKIHNCIQKDCRGFLTENNTPIMTCGVCSIKVCKDCREPRRDDEHKCDPNIVENVKAIEKECKPCPKCSSMIYFVSGCFDGETIIPLYDGTFKHAKEIKKGDVLIGDDGNKREVLDTVSGFDDMYEVNQSNGISYTVNSKHTLLLKAKDKITNTYEILAENFYKHQYNNNKLYGYKGFNNNIILSKLQVKKLDKNKYYGWKVDNNNRFILSDFTVAKNCSQMWCTQCQTAFNWKTGKIETGIIHNPHYWEYIKKLGQEDAEVNRMFGNGGNADLPQNEIDLCNFRFEDLLRNKTFATNIQHISGDVLDLFRQINHMSRFERDRYDVNLDDPKINEDIRMKYLSNEVNEDYMKSLIQRRYKMNEFKSEMFQIIDTFVTVSRTLCVKYYHLIMKEGGHEKLFVSWMNEMSELTTFSLDSVVKLSKRFSYKVPSGVESTLESFLSITERVKDFVEKGKLEKGLRVYLMHMFNTYSSKYRYTPYSAAKREIEKLWSHLSEEQRLYYVSRDK